MNANSVVSLYSTLHILFSSYSSLIGSIHLVSCHFDQIQYISLEIRVSVAEALSHAICLRAPICGHKGADEYIYK
jgi:hypothetical protein